jgi:hypothetical protein
MVNFTRETFFSKFFYLAYSFDGIIVFVLLIICTCGYMRRVPKLREWFLSEKRGFAGIFYKGLFFVYIDYYYYVCFSVNYWYTSFSFCRNLMCYYGILACIFKIKTSFVIK